VAHIVGVLVWILIGVATVGAELRWINIERSTVTLHIFELGARRSVATNHIIEAPLEEGSLDDTKTPHLALVINLGQLRVIDPGRSANERQSVLAQMLGPLGLDAYRFSRVVYHSLAIDQVESGVWLVQGELEMHGRFLPLNLHAVRNGDRFTGTTTVSPTAFGIPLMLGSTQISNEVRVDFDIVLEAP
jgi:hypothetical protein